MRKKTKIKVISPEYQRILDLEAEIDNSGPITHTGSKAERKRYFEWLRNQRALKGKQD